MSDQASVPRGIVRNRIKTIEQRISHGNVKTAAVRPKFLNAFPQTESAEVELTQIEQEIQHLQRSLVNTYKNYIKKTLIYYQDKIILLHNRNDVIDKKSELGKLLKVVNKKLNAIILSRVCEANEDSQGEPDEDSKGEADEDSKSEADEDSKGEADEDSKGEADEDSTGETDEESKGETDEDSKRDEILRRLQKMNAIATPFAAKLPSPSSSVVSVRNLKGLFERNNNENEGAADFGPRELSKYSIFNNSAESKYISFRQRLTEENGLANDTDSRPKGETDENSEDGADKDTKRNKILRRIQKMNAVALPFAAKLPSPSESVEQAADVPQVLNPTEHDADSSQVSVLNLKRAFEINDNENEGAADFGPREISYSTFNPVDSKYVLFSQRLTEANGLANDTDSRSISSEIYDVTITPGNSDDETLKGDKTYDYEN